MKERNLIFNKLFALTVIYTISCGSFSAFAQKPKTLSVKCSGAWTGVITYTRTQTVTNNKTVERVSGRGRDTTNFEMNYTYTASVGVVESPDGTTSSSGKAVIDSKMTSTETVSAVESNSCDRGKTFKEMHGDSTSKTETSGNEKETANVNVGVNSDGTYSVSVGIPQIKGKVSGSQTSTFSGQCTAKEGKNLNLPATETTIDGHSLTSDGTDRINPKDPNRLSGSYSLKIPGGVTEMISWNLQKCGAPLRLIDVKFEDMKFPNWNDWQEIIEQTGTTDGNLVKIKAKVFNASGETKYADLKFKETYKGDKWDGARPDGLLENGLVSSRVDAGEVVEVEMLWDSSGYAWFDDGRPRLVQRIKAELEEDGTKVDEKTQNLKVAPKPVVLVHGLWSDWKKFETWQNILTTSHSYDWKAFPVGEKADKGAMNMGKFMTLEPGNSLTQNAEQLKNYVRYAQENRNAWHVDLVAHSTGGLVARNYVNQLMPSDTPDGRPQVSHLLLMGTPNTGSPCADMMYKVTGNQALYQATSDFAKGFNRMNPNTRGVKFSALAGIPVPTICYSTEANDGFVTVKSAKWTIKDTADSQSLHPDLGGTVDFSNFIKPRLAIGPKGDHNPDLPSIPVNPNGQNFRSDSGAYFMNASYKTPSRNEFFDDTNFAEPDFSKSVKIAPKSSAEIEIPVAPALNFGLIMMALPEVSATLYNETGAIVGKNSAKTPEANAWFRSIFVDKNVSSGIWKLKLENTSDRELEAVIATWKVAAS